jgi:dGTPase
LERKIIEKYPHLKEVHGFHMNDFGAKSLRHLWRTIGNWPLGILRER